MKSSEIPENAFVVSTDELEQSNTRDELIKSIDAECASIRELAWNLRTLFHTYEDARSAFAPGKDIDKILELHRAFILAEGELNQRIEAVDKKVHAFNVGKSIHERIYVSHTAEGIPIHVDKLRKIPIFGV